MFHLGNLRSSTWLPARPYPRRNCSISRTFSASNSSSKVDNARSDLVLQETALFLYQLQYDTRLQQAMTVEAYDAAKSFRTQRDEVDSMIEKFQNEKGPNSGAAPLSDEFIESTTTGLTLRLDLSKAIEEERYEDAAKLRDAISKLSDQIENSEIDGDRNSTNSLRFNLGQLVQHKSHRYRGVVCGYDHACCESKEWQSKQNIEIYTQPYYHVLVDERDWPPYTRGPPVAYIAQEELMEMEGDLESERSNFRTIEHPFIINMFLGKDNLGAYIPSVPLRNKYKINRRDVYPSSEDE